MTAREVLAEIEQRADSHALAAGGIETASDPWFSAANWADKPHRLVFDLVGDNRALVAALRAVLDLHEPTTDQRYTCGECEYFSPCPTQRAIASALGSSLGGGA